MRTPIFTAYSLIHFSCSMVNFMGSMHSNNHDICTSSVYMFSTPYNPLLISLHSRCLPKRLSHVNDVQTCKPVVFNISSPWTTIKKYPDGPFCYAHTQAMLTPRLCLHPGYAYTQAMLTPRRGFTIRLKRLKPRAPDFGRPQNFASRTISSISANIIFVFLFWFNTRFLLCC